MSVLKFKYRLDKTCRIVTWSAAGALAAAVVLLRLFSPGEYLPVWFTGISTALAALAALSVPRQIRVTDEAVEIRCVLEITHIPWHHIRGVRRVERSELGFLIPVFASPGFFGWFGYWLAPRSWDFIKVYASSWHGLVMIEDVYEQKYVVNADDPAALCEAVKAAMRRAAETTAARENGSGKSKSRARKKTAKSDQTLTFP